MHIQYNTPAHRKLFKDFVKRYDDCDKVENIEPRVRLLSQIVRESGLGVSIWSCEGHDDADMFSPYCGYVMFMARNRDAATRLVDVFQRCSAAIVDGIGWEALPSIETSLASLEEDTSYTCVVIRSPSFENPEFADKFWDIVTRRTYNHLKHYISVNPEFQMESV